MQILKKLFRNNKKIADRNSQKQEVSVDKNAPNTYVYVGSEELKAVTDQAIKEIGPLLSKLSRE